MSGKVASEVIAQIEPRVVIPMTYAVEGLKETLGTVDAFCKELGVCRREEGTKYKITRRDLPEEDRGRYNTIAGLLMAETGRLPALGERIACAGWIFEIVDLDGKRIDKVLAEKSLESA